MDGVEATRHIKTQWPEVRVIALSMKHLGLWDTRNHDPPHLDDAHIATIETELTYDYTYSQLSPIDYWTQ
jgi:hypothetical protein